MRRCISELDNALLSVNQKLTIEKVKARDVEDGLKKQFISQRNKYYAQNLKQDFINSYLNHSKKSTNIDVNEKLIQSTLANLKISY